MIFHESCSGENLWDESVIGGRRESINHNGDALDFREEYLTPIESKIWRIDGSLIHVELSIRTLMTANGRLFIATIRDLTEQKRTQQTLHQQAHIIERSQSFVFVFDEHNRIEWFNPRFANLLGYQLDEVRGEPVYPLLFGEHTDHESARLVKESVRNRNPFNVEMLIHHRNGRPLWVQIDAHPLTDEATRQVKFVALGVETTERKFAEKMQSDFISMVSHDLRTPLTVIAGAFEALAMNPETRSPEVIDMMVEMGHRNCGRLERLIEDLLDINQLESGTISLKQEKLVVRDVLLRSIEDVQELSKRAGIQVSMDECPASAMVRADPLRVNQNPQ